MFWIIVNVLLVIQYKHIAVDINIDENPIIATMYIGINFIILSVVSDGAAVLFNLNDRCVTSVTIIGNNIYNRLTAEAPFSTSLKALDAVFPKSIMYRNFPSNIAGILFIAS